ncbi:MAG TPA: FAD-dependent oxidoreductase [Kiritimatiellia bacterium]|nr:FAD-dependent oxidoreductase [Kiritimatiellia bacterium]HRU71630.1 FAD-dependent oxidoreductase [Kiritimatiellia bacterium]
MKVVIIGGVAAGASAAARLRRLDEKAEIILLEKGASISYANCGLPYHVGGVIRDRSRLLVMPPAKFAAWFNVDVRTNCEATAIDRQSKEVEVTTAGGVARLKYDKLLIATGATPDGDVYTDATHPHVAHLWTLADMDRVMGKLGTAKHVMVVGAGFIGLEVAENLRHRGIAVTMIQRGAHVLPTLDAEMAQPLAAELRGMGVEIRFGRRVAEFSERADSVEAILDNGERLAADFAIVSTGVRPGSELAKAAGLEHGPRGHIVVDEHLRTSDPDIFAAGDVIEVVDPVFGGSTAIALAGPANKQGRIAADNMAGGASVYRGTFGASVVKVGELTAAAVGWTEARLKAAKRDYRKIYIHPSSGAGYYPGAVRLNMKLLFGNDGTIYGAQIVGAKGVDKRIDTLAMAMRTGLKAPQLGELELAYAPPYSSAKDPVNFLGFVAENVLTGKSDAVAPDTLPADAQILDVREPAEHETGAIPGAVNLRLADLRARLGELDRSKTYVTCCAVGLRGYLAERILKQNGFKAHNLSGGWATWKLFHPDPQPARDGTPSQNTQPVQPSQASTLDLRQLPCPGPVVTLRQAFQDAADGTTFKVLADATFEDDLKRWCAANACQALGLSKRGGELEATLVKRAAVPTPAQAVSATDAPFTHSVAIVLFSNDLDKALAAMILANGLAASGAKVGIFFTFWGLAVLRKNPAPAVRKNLIARLFGWMLPSGAEKLALSKMHMLGVGTGMMKNIMRRQNIMSLPDLIKSAKAAGVRFIACDMAMGVMGLTRDELIDEVDEVAGVAAFADLARKSNNTLFI